MIAASVAALTLSACAEAPAERTALSAGAYAGPHAQEFAYWADREGTPEFALNAMADSEITEAELAEAESRFAACASGFGILVSNFDALEGSYSTGPLGETTPTGTLADVDACELSSGYLPLMVIYGTVARNPENRDLAEVVTECLVRNGAVAADYPSERYLYDAEHGSFPFSDPVSGEQILDGCVDDPFGYVP